MKTKPLSDLKIKTAKIKDKNYQLGDSSGLFLNVKSNGIKQWEMRYTSPITKKRKLGSFGSYPLVSLSVARTKRDEYIELIASGIDPIDNKKKERKSTELDINGLCINVIDEWLEKESQRTKEITHKSKIRLFNNDVKPFLMKKHIKDVCIQDIVKIVEQKQIQAPESASRLFNNLDRIFRFAVLKSYCNRNILSDINKDDVIIIMLYGI